MSSKKYMPARIHPNFNDFSDTEKKIIDDSTMELLGPIRLSEKYQIPEQKIYKILKMAGLKAAPNIFENNVSKSEYPRKSKDMPLEEYRIIQLRHYEHLMSVKKQNFNESGRKPTEYCEDFPKETDYATKEEYDLVLLSSLPVSKFCE